jgi:hypothetical protein
MPGFPLYAAADQLPYDTRAFFSLDESLPSRAGQNRADRRPPATARSHEAPREGKQRQQCPPPCSALPPMTCEAGTARGGRARRRRREGFASGIFKDGAGKLERRRGSRRDLPPSPRARPATNQPTANETSAFPWRRSVRGREIPQLHGAVASRAAVALVRALLLDD